MGDQVGALSASYSGKLSAKRASGTLEATITVLDKASRSVVATCRTGSVRWSATRSPGRVFGGSTAQDLPVVVRLDAKRRAVADMLFNWESATCKPEDVYLNTDEDFSGFPLASGRFGDAFDQSYTTGRRRRGQGQLRHHRPRRAHARERQRAGQRHGDRPGGRRHDGVRQRQHPLGGRQRLSGLLIGDRPERLVPVGVYGDHVLPRIIDVACNMKVSLEQRERVCEGLAGEVVEIGFGSARTCPSIRPP